MHPLPSPTRRTALRVRTFGLAALLGLSTWVRGAVAPATAAPVADAVARDALRLLKAECFSCHNEKKKKGGLVLTSRDAVLKGAESGPVFDPKQPESSPLADVLRASADPHMPPERQLSAAQIRLLKTWLKRGAAWDDNALLEDDAKPVALAALPAGYQPVLALALAPDAKRLAVARGGTIALHDTAAKDLPALGQIAAHRDAVQSLAWSPDGHQLASGAFRRVVLWDAETRQPVREWTEGLLGKITALQFSPDGTKLVFADGVAGRSGIVRLVGLPDGKRLAAWPAHDDTLYGVEFSRDGTRLASAGGDRLIKIWEPGTHRELARLEGHSAQVLCVAFNPDATQVVSGGVDKELNMWDVTTREKINSLGNHTAAVSAVSWPGDGKTIIAATGNGAVFAYTNLQRHAGTERSKGGDEKKIGESTDAVLCAVSSSDAETLYTGTHDGLVHVWSRKGKVRAKLTAAAPAPGATPAAPPVATVSFLRDVLPALTRAGCSTGGCHAKAEGQNGFKLSVFTYDPKGDFEAIVMGARGRRVFPAAPEQSLIIQKPTTAIDHEGGRKFEPGSDLHQLLVRWLREGMPYRLPNEPDLQRLTVTPPDRTYRAGAEQRLKVEAHYSDGTKRDVTKLAAFASNDPEVATVNDRGLIKAGTLPGQAVVVARYMGLVADSQITVPADRTLPEKRYAALPKNNFIDELAYAHFRRLGLFPSDLCTDAEFLRRAKLDAVGLLPDAGEVRAFLADPSPAKRAEFIRRVVEAPAYADYWATKWADLVRPNPDRVGLKSVFVLDHWLRESFRRNQTYDAFARDILLAEGTNHQDGPAVIYRDRREPADRATMFGQLFLGTRLECAKCHNHPNEKWSQNDFYQFAAFFGPVKQKGAGLSPPISAGTETFYFSPGGEVKHPVTGAVLTPRPLDGTYQPAEKNEDPRRALVASLLAPDNPYFAAAAVNRVWANFFGRGLVEPVDDFRLSNPAVNPPLLAALAKDFVAHGYDLKHLMRTIMASRLYQLSTTPNATNRSDTRNFSRAYRRRLPAEVLLDAVNDVTGGTDTFAGMPPGSRAMQAWSYKIESQFMDAFSRPDPSMDPPCERDTHISVVQSLHLMNSKALQTKLAHPNGRARQLAAGNQTPAAIVAELYLSTLGRPPTAEELAVATAAFTADKATRTSATEDVFWALLNSAEFVFNH